MATLPSDIPNIEKQISEQEKQAGIVQGKLNSSPTALGGKGIPTAFDVKNQTTLEGIQNAIQGLKNKKIDAQWYPPKDQNAADDKGSSPGWIGSTLDFISRPLYAVVGATKHAVGQGSGSLYQDVADNMVRNKNTFGDVLGTIGAPKIVSAPLGFALDVMMDPLNWVTVGTSALLPRLVGGVAKGFSTGKGAMRGLSIAAKSGLMEKANTIGRFTPLLRGSKAFAKFGEKTLESTAAWEALSGKTAEKLVQEGGIVGLRNLGYHGSLMDLTNKAADAIPGGQNFLEKFVYDPIDWVKKARMKDILQTTFGPDVDVTEIALALSRNEDITPMLNAGKAKRVSVVENIPVGETPFNIDLDQGGFSMGKKEIDEIDKGIEAINGRNLQKEFEEVGKNITGEIDDTA